MATKFENMKVVEAFDPDARYLDEFGTVPRETQGENELDNEENTRLIRHILEWWNRERQLQSENRLEMATDCDYYDGLQWTDEEATELLERGQAPLVFNKIKQAVDWILGTEKRTRVDFKVFPRGDEDVKNADSKTNLLKYLSDVNRNTFHRSRAFADQVKAGLGWLEDGIRNDESEEIIYSRCEDWRNVWYDSNSVEPDMSDARYLFRARPVDLDYAKAMFPDRADVLESNSITSSNLGMHEDESQYMPSVYQARDEYGRVIGQTNYLDDAFDVDNKRPRVRLVECWYKKPERITRVYGDPRYDGEEFDDENKDMTQAVNEEILSTYDALVERMHVCIFVGDKLLYKGKTPYRHQKFPLTPLWGYRRKRDNAPYGAIRNSRDPQFDLNKRASKSLFILSTNQVIADKHAVDDWDEAIEEASRPDGVIKLNGDRRFEIRQDKQLAQQHLDLMDRDQMHILDGTGVTDENLGKDTNAISGKAILAKQNEGSVVTAELFDNLRLAMQIQGEKQLSMIEQFYDEQKVLRIIGDKGKFEFHELNAPELDPVTGELVIKNDITSTKADFVVDTQDFRESMRVAMFETMMDMIGKLPPEIGFKLLDMVVDLVDVPGKDEMVARIRDLNGMKSPEGEETPEEAAEREAKEQAEQQERQLMERERMAGIEEKESRTEKTRVETQVAALNTAREIAATPEVADMADELLGSAGYQDQAQETDGGSVI